MTDEELRNLGLSPSLSTVPPRATGRTTRQLLDAPAGALFVWVNEKLTYPRDLIRTVNRWVTDHGNEWAVIRVQVESPSFIRPEKLEGNHWPVVIVDHAVWDCRHTLWLDHLREYARHRNIEVL